MKPVPRLSQTDVVAGQIKEHLLSDRIQIGDKLPTEKEFCESLDVGRSTVREALRVLQVMGYVKIHPGRGAFLQTKNLDTATPALVSWLSVNQVQVEDIIEVRLGLETLAVKLAVDRATEDDFDALDKVRLAFEETLASGEYDKLAGLDETFHQIVIDAAKNHLLTALNRMVAVAFHDHREKIFRSKEHASRVVAPHRDITNSLRLRDADLAQVFVRRHLEKIREDRQKPLGAH